MWWKIWKVWGKWTQPRRSCVRRQCRRRLGVCTPELCPIKLAVDGGMEPAFATARHIATIPGTLWAADSGRGWSKTPDDYRPQGEHKGPSLEASIGTAGASSGRARPTAPPDRLSCATCRTAPASRASVHNVGRVWTYKGDSRARVHHIPRFPVNSRKELVLNLN